MARPISNMETYLPQPGPDNGGDQNGRSLIPNGQPAQFGRQPIYPEKMARPMMGHHMLQNTPLTATSNGIQQQYSHPSSLSSHSSRDASPVPHRPPFSGPSSHQPSPSATPPPFHPSAASSHRVPSENNHPSGTIRQQLPPNFNPGSVRQPVDPRQQLPASAPNTQMFRPPVGPPSSQFAPSIVPNQAPNIPTSSDAQRFAPNQTKPVLSQASLTNLPPSASQPGLVTSQPNTVQNPATSFALQTNQATNFPPTQPSQSMNFPPPPSNQNTNFPATMNFAPPPPNQAPNFPPTQPNKSTNFAPPPLNKAPNFPSTQPNSSMNFAPVPPVSSYAPTQSNLPPRFVPPQTNTTASSAVINQSRYPPMQTNTTTNNVSMQANTAPSFAPVPTNTAPSSAPVQSKTTPSYAPVQTTTGPSYAPALSNTGPSYAPGQINTALSSVPLQSKATPGYTPGQSTVPSYAPSQPNTGPSYAPATANTGPSYAPGLSNTANSNWPMPTNTTPAHTNTAPSYAPMPTNNAPSFPPNSSQRSSAASFPSPSVANPMVQSSASGTMPPSAANQSQATVQSRMAPYGVQSSPLRQPISSQPPNPPFGSPSRPPNMPQGQNGPTTQYGMAPPQSRLPSGPPPLPGQSAPPQPNFGPPQNGPYGQPPVKASVPGEGSSLPKRYPQAPSQTAYGSQMAPRPGSDANFNQQLAGLSVAQQGFSKLWGAEHYDLLQTRNILPAEKVEVPRVKLQQEFLDAVNCSPEIFRCTLTKIPETNALLQKSRLPLGVLIHPFKDLNHLAVIQCQSIVRCRACRTYINPFVYFVDHKRWKCNLCFRVNELPEEFQFDPVSKTYGDPSRRPEIKSATIEFIAPSEYMLRPPQPAVYLFLLDVSCLATECGYLALACAVLLEELDRLPGDARTQVGFIAYDTCLRFYSLAEGLNQPQEMTVMDVDDVFLPCPDTLIVNLNECKELVKDLLRELPKRFAQSHDNNSCLGAALQAAFKLMSSTGGRVTVFQACLPNLGPGALAAREDPSARAAKDVPHLNPATDFYKRLALDCSGQQIAVDLFIVNQQYCDLATLSGVSRFSGGSIHHFPLFKANDGLKYDALEVSLRRYLTRKLGLEAVMRIRCSRGLAIHTFHGNFFVRSTDLLSLPNVNPDAGFAMQVAVEESLAELQNVCFQAALLYTSSKGERRIRVHTLCLPVAANLSDILHSADQQCIVGLLAKMAVDRSLQSSLGDAREAFINVAVDILSAYKVAQPGASSALAAPHNLRLLPLYILALLKYVAFRTGQSTRLDDRVFAMCQMKTLPLAGLMQEIYPDLYPVHRLLEQATIDVEGTPVAQPPRLHLSAEKLESSGAFLLDAGAQMILFVGRNVGATFCQAVFQVNSFLEVPENLLDLPVIETPESEALRHYIAYLQSDKPWPATLQVIRDDSQDRNKFYERLLEDRTESSLSYYEFLQHLKTNVK